MALDYLHNHNDFSALLRILEDQRSILAGLIEKDPEYTDHKKDRFPKKDQEISIAANEAFKLSDPSLREAFKKRYLNTKPLYYNGQPDFEEVLKRIHEHLSTL